MSEPVFTSGDFRVESETIPQHYAIFWGGCNHGVQTHKDGEQLPDPPCPYCRIALLEKSLEHEGLMRDSAEREVKALRESELLEQGK